MSAVVMVVGEGLLADRVCGDLSTQYEVIRRYDFEAGVPETTDLVLVLHDTLNPSIHKKSGRGITANRHTLAARLCFIWRRSDWATSTSGNTRLLPVCRQATSHGRTRP